MLPKKNRLKKKKDFERVFMNGKIIKCQDLFLKYIDNDKEDTKIGIVVSKKVSKKAVDRNKAKRRIREAFRLIGSKLKNGINMIAVAYPSVKNREFSDIKEQIEAALTKAELIN